MRKTIGHHILSLLPAILTFLLVLFEPFSGLDAMVCDFVYNRMNGCGSTIKIIAIDEKTLDAYGPLSGWSREKSAQLIETLCQDPEHAPAVLAFDIMFIGEKDAETDQHLAQAAGQAGNVVLATNLVYRGKTKYTAQGIPYYDAWNIAMEELPYPALHRQAASGFANTLISPDGFVRSTRLHSNVNGEKRYSFASQIYLTYARLSAAAPLAPLPAHQNVGFFYSGKPGEFPHYSLKDVLEGKLPEDEFAGSIVMVGAYSAGLQDAYHTCADRGQDMYGVEINANIVRALMLGKTSVPVDKQLSALIFAMIILVYTCFARKLKVYPALGLGILFAASGTAGARILSVYGYTVSLFYYLAVIVLIWYWVIIERYFTESLRRRQTMRTFKKYMSPQVIDSLLRDGSFRVELGGEKRHIAVLFADIRGFTALSEIVPPEQLVQILNRYLSLTVQCIFDHSGTLDKFIGDAALAVFNAPADLDDYIYRAILSGLDMQRKGQALSEDLLNEYGRSVSFGVGIHAGDAVVGNIGCDTRMDYTAIGDTVNTASRIEGKAKPGQVLISGAVYEAVKDRIFAEFMGDMLLKGKSEPIQVYIVKGIL